MTQPTDLLSISSVISARPPSKAYRLQKALRRNKLAFAAVTAIAASLVIGIAASVWQAVRATRAEKKTGETLAQVSAERDAKELARQDAEAISTFLSEVFQSPDPSRDGRTITVAETLDKAAKKLETHLATQPARRAKLQITLGRTYRGLGLAGKAIPLAEKARDYYLATFGPAHPDTLSTTRSLAISYSDAGRGGEAVKLAEEALAIQRRLNGSEHPDTLEAMQTLAYLYSQVGSRNAALKLQEEALPLRLKVSGPEHPATLNILRDLAWSYRQIGAGMRHSRCTSK